MAGATGAFAGNPGDLAMVRMQADGKLPPEQREELRMDVEQQRFCAASCHLFTARVVFDVFLIVLFSLFSPKDPQVVDTRTFLMRS